MPRVTDSKRPWLPWYGLARWKRLRAAQLMAQPLCQLCLDVECVTEATVADHVKPHRGDEMLFWDAGNLQSLCASCHSRHKQAEEHGRTVVRFDASGWPI